MKKNLYILLFALSFTYTFATFGYSTGVLKGQKDKYICNIQEFLIKYSYLKIEKPTCYFGILTEKAIKEYQADSNLEITGKWDWETSSQYQKDRLK